MSGTQSTRQVRTHGQQLQPALLVLGSLLPQTETRHHRGDTVRWRPPPQWGRRTHKVLTVGEDVERVTERFDSEVDCPNDVELLPQFTDVTLEEAITDSLDFLIHEAFCVVDREFEVTAYRTPWLGLQ